MKTKDTETTKTQTAVTQKFGRFDPAVWAKFDAWCDKRGMRTSSFIDRIVTDVIDGHYIHLHQLRPEAVLELERSADETAMSVDLLVGRILSDWCVGKMAERKKKK